MRYLLFNFLKYLKLDLKRLKIVFSSKNVPFFIVCQIKRIHSLSSSQERLNGIHIVKNSSLLILGHNLVKSLT